MRDEDNKVVCFEDGDGDILQVNKERDEDGQRYVAVICAGDEQGVMLTADQQLVVASTMLGFDPTLPPDEYRAKAAERAGNILRASGSLFGGSGAVSASEVIELAEWIAYGDPDEDCCL